MSWMGTLLATYERCRDLVGEFRPNEPVLLPLGHISQKAQLEVTVSKEGRFVAASAVPKTEAATVLPATDESAIRSSGTAPHPLCDQLGYLAPFPGEKEDKYPAYLEGLRAWCASPYGHPKAKAVLAYAEKGEILKDLMREGLVTREELDKAKKYLVRFRVLGEGEEPAVYRDQTLFDSYAAYRASLINEWDVDYVTGEVTKVTDKHPVGIIQNPYKAKLISANDSADYTYRGRFRNPKEALSVGYEVSQKAHSALKWLIERQGDTRDGGAVVAWYVGGELPGPQASTWDILGPAAAEPETGRDYATALAKWAAGYGGRKDFDTTLPMAVMVLDAATTGRLSITYYREVKGSEYLARMVRWYGSCYWRLLHWQEDKIKLPVEHIATPVPREMALAAYGAEQEKGLTAPPKLIRSTVKRILSCIVDGRPLPYDIVHAAVVHAGQPLHYKGNNWERVLDTTCAMVRKYRYDVTKGKEEWDVALDRNCQDRNYLFGRMLALYNAMEAVTYDPKEDEKRQTNAVRFWTRFVARPLDTAAELTVRVQPYLAKLQWDQKAFYERALDEIFDRFEEGDYSNEPLTGLYLLGYRCQNMALRKSKKSKEDGHEQD